MAVAAGVAAALVGLVILLPLLLLMAVAVVVTLGAGDTPTALPPFGQPVTPFPPSPPLRFDKGNGNYVYS